MMLTRRDFAGRGVMCAGAVLAGFEQVLWPIPGIAGLQDRIKHLEGVLPTCMYCKKIRDDSGTWTSIEHYISQRTEASFSHGVCPTCYEAVVKPEIDRSRSGNPSQ